MTAMSTWAEISVWLSMVLSASAGWANMYGAWVWRGRLMVQLFYIALSVMAWVYSLGYIWLISTGDRLAWSQFFGNLGPFIWLLVWNIPPIAIAHVRNKELLTLRASSQKAQDHLEKRAESGMEL